MNNMLMEFEAPSFCIGVSATPDSMGVVTCCYKGNNGSFFCCNGCSSGVTSCCAGGWSNGYIPCCL